MLEPLSSPNGAPPGRQHRKIRIFLAVSLLLAAAAGGGWYYWNEWNAGTEAAAGGPAGKGPRDKTTPIIVDAAVNEDFPVRLSAIGTVVPRTVVTVRSRVDGTLNRVLFNEGQTVKAGQLLAEIDPRPFEVALTQMQGQMARDQALLANARADLERYENLARLDAIPAQQLDTQRALVRQYEGAVKIDQGQVDNARLQLSYTRVTAPSDGRVGLRQVDPGNLVRSSDTNGLVIITQVQPVTVVFPIAEGDLGKLLTRLGMKRPKSAKAGAELARDNTLRVEAWDRDGKVLLASGELLTVDNQIDVATGTVKVKALFPNQDGALFPNQFVNVRLVVNELKDAVVIPSAAVQRGTRGNFVWLLGGDKTITMRPVNVGVPDADRIPVLEGLKAGEQVAVDGFDRLREGGKVEVVTRESRAVRSGPGKGGAKGGGPAAGNVATPAPAPAGSGTATRPAS